MTGVVEAFVSSARLVVDVGWLSLSAGLLMVVSYIASHQHTTASQDRIY